MMSTKIRGLVFLLFLTCIYQVFSEVVKFNSCGNKNCTVKELRITPCPEAAKNRPCVLTWNTYSVVEFDFITVPNISNVTIDVTWMGRPWPDFDTDACKNMKCPTTGGKQTFKYKLEVKTSYPAAFYIVEWKLHKPGVMQCCFTTRIEIFEGDKKN